MAVRKTLVRKLVRMKNLRTAGGLKIGIKKEQRVRFPEINSRGLHILQALRHKPMTIWQGMEAHGVFASRQQPQGMDASQMQVLYCELVERGCLIREGIVYRLSLAALHRLQSMDTPDQQFIPGVAMPRIRDIWTEPQQKPLALLSGRYKRL